ncbi:hypothetical protein [Chryseobacterium sp.]|uniref:hypothetical protein n=1 Tax=Chryseobacterium sp. TaxID=1871047 RepID=UPI0028A1F6C9|nr:hypothetical protein [Chryseobacterium sp.]
MKYLFLLLFLPTLLFSQTSISNDDIYAAAGNDYETLLTNVYIEDEGGFAINHFLNKMGFSPYHNAVYSGDYFKQKYIQQISTGNSKPSFIEVSYLNQKLKGSQSPITTKVEITGDTESVVKFYANFWSRAFNFRDTKPGEVVTTRFLTDVAALSVGSNGQSKIVVTTAKDYYN